MSNSPLSLPAQSNSDSNSSSAEVLDKSNTDNSSQNTSKYKSKTEIKKALDNATHDVRIALVYIFPVKS